MVVNKQFLRLGRTSPDQMRGKDLQAMTAGKIAVVCPSDRLKPALQADQKEAEAFLGFPGDSPQESSGTSAAGYAVWTISGTVRMPIHSGPCSRSAGCVRKMRCEHHLSRRRRSFFSRMMRLGLRHDRRIVSVSMGPSGSRKLPRSPEPEPYGEGGVRHAAKLLRLI